MKQELTALSDHDLLQEYKRLKSGNLIQATLIGVLLGIAVYSAVTKGFGFFTLFPLVFAFILFRKRNNSVAVEEEIKRRNLK